MNNRKSLIPVIGIVLALQWGCATHSITKTSGIPIEIQTRPNISIDRVCVHPEADQLVIHGTVKRHPLNRSAEFGHIDIAISDQTGSVLQKQCLALLPRHLARNLASSSFETVLDHVDSRSPSISIRYHDQIFACENPD